MHRTWVLLVALASCARAEPMVARRVELPEVERRVVVSLGRPSGTSITTRDPDGTLHTVLDVLENGRGPHVEAELQLDGDLTLRAFTARGRHEFGTTYTTQFTRVGAQARWRGDEEGGDAQLSGPAFYVPIAEVPEVEGLLVRAALRNGGTLRVLPAGEVRVHESAEALVSVAGRSERLIAYAIEGLGFVPTQTWFHRDGRWFGSVSEWWSVVPEGAVLEPLLAKQREVERARAREAARACRQPIAEAGLAYTHARVLDVERGRWLLDQTVLVVGDTIRAVGAELDVPAAAEIVDLRGRAILPGLWDMHAHLGDADGALAIASGVTTVRDVGNDPDKLDDYKARFDAGEAIGPHVLRFGFIEGRGEKAASSTITAESAQEAREAVRFFAERHYEGVKIYSSVKPELVPIITAEAHARQMLVTGHIPVHMLAHEAVRAGYDGIEHINMLALNFLADHDTDTRDLTRFTLVGERAAELDLRSQPVQAFFALLAQRKTVVDPTLGAFEGLLVGEPGKVPPGLEALVARLPVNAARAFLTGGLPARDQRYQAAFEKLLAMTRALYEADVTLVAGTDDIAGLMLHHELELLARAGIPNAAILRMATIAPARASGLADRVGTIAAGKRADLIVVDGDPLARIADIERVVSTMRAGVRFESSKVYRTVSVRP